MSIACFSLTLAIGEAGAEAGTLDTLWYGLKAAQMADIVTLLTRQNEKRNDSKADEHQKKTNKKQT